MMINVAPVLMILPLSLQHLAFVIAWKTMLILTLGNPKSDSPDIKVVMDVLSLTPQITASSVLWAFT